MIRRIWVENTSFNSVFFFFLYKMASYDQQAKDIIKDAQKKINSWGFSFFYSLEDIAEMYEKAGNMFKLAQQCTY